MAELSTPPSETEEYPVHSKASLLADELKIIVREVIQILGDSVHKIYGEKSYQCIEALRLDMKENRKNSGQSLQKILKKNYEKLSSLESKELYQIAHSFALYLELINRCEKAYRQYRINKDQILSSPKEEQVIIYVFTAHPTEARSPQILFLLGEIEKILVQSLKKGGKNLPREILSHYIGLCLRTEMAKSKNPSVLDEAWHIFSITLTPDILQEQIHLKRKKITVYFRSWVGGDKDGHPYVNEETMMSSWQIGRKFILDFMIHKLELGLEDCKRIENDSISHQFIKGHTDLTTKANQLYDLLPSDGKRILELKERLLFLKDAYNSEMGIPSPHLEDIHALFWLYPALVLPLELREDVEELKSSDVKKSVIFKMLKTLESISRGHDPKWYVRGLVLSMVHSAEDIQLGIDTISTVFKKLAIPCVPLFETQKALDLSASILESCFLKNPHLIGHHQNKWGGRFEIMLGYSDSSKESGVFASRYFIGQSLKRIDHLFKKKKLIPIFFHGSGGSIERGGGSIQEQTSWWPKSALTTYKVTIQGEMVSRSFGSSEIMRGQVKKIRDQWRGKKRNKSMAPNKNFELALEKFILETQQNYKELLGSEVFIEAVQKATPYLYLDQLKIGSRPSKRSTGDKEIKLRAIPWVLCWTQTRTLLPSWFGVGSAWEKLGLEERYYLHSGLEQSEFFLSFLKILGFGLAKVELDVFFMYLDHFMDTHKSSAFKSTLTQELAKTQKFLKEMSRNPDLLWFRPWLSESIELRSSMIHPLNLIQMIALERKDAYLLRESVSGISCGMLTTG